MATVQATPAIPQMGPNFPAGLSKQQVEEIFKVCFSKLSIPR